MSFYLSPSKRDCSGPALERARGDATLSKLQQFTWNVRRFPDLCVLQFDGIRKLITTRVEKANLLLLAHRPEVIAYMTSAIRFTLR